MWRLSQKLRDAASSDMQGILDVEGEALKLRLLAIAAAVAGLQMHQDDILRDLETLVFVLGLAIAYLAYTLSLRTLILPRIKTPWVVSGMILVDVAALATVTHLAGGPQSTIFTMFPVIIIFYALHLDYLSSFFAALVVSCSLAAYMVLVEGGSTTGVLAFQIPLFFMLAYFGGFLVRRAGREARQAASERAKREALQRFVRIEGMGRR